MENHPRQRVNLREIFLSALVPGIRSRYPWAMPLRFALAFVFCAPFTYAAPSPVPAKPKAKAISERTWQTLTKHVMENGIELPIKAPACRTLGYDSDSVPAKALRLKSANSKDGREHAVYIVYDLTEKKDILRPREIVVGSIRVEEKDSVKDIQSYRVRLNLNGHPISAMRADGIVGKVKQQPLSIGSKEAKKLLATEKKFFLEDVDLSQLTQ